MGSLVNTKLLRQMKMFVVTSIFILQAMITERKELLDNIVRTKEINKAGAYIIRLNHFGRWKDVIVDNLLPCDQNQRLIYAKVHMCICNTSNR